MNTPGSMALGWGLLLVAGGGGLYFAKKDINQRRREQARRGLRPTEKREWHERIDEQTKKTSDTDLPTNQKNEEPTRHDEAQPGSLSNTFNKFDRPQHQISNHKSQARRDLEPKG